MLYITLALALTFTPQPPAAASTLLNKIPDWTNALTVVDFKNILASPIAQREGWDKLPPADLLGGSVPYPRNTELAMLASHLEPGSLRSQRDLALVVGGPFSPIKELAKAENGYEETVAGISTVLSPKNAYLFNLEPKVFAIASPAHRQDTARWIRATQNNPTVTISNYLQQAYSSIGEGYHIVVSIDLQDAINPVLAKRFLMQSPLLKNKKVDVDALSKVLASSRGIRIGVRFDQTIKATLAADFNDNIKAFANILPALVLSSLDDMGGEMEEFPAASATVQDKTFLITSTLSMKGLRRVLSLVPPVNGPVLVQRDPGIKAKPGDDTAPANQRYFKAIREAANDAHASADQKNDMIQAAQGYEKAAARIDQLAVANIDEELVKFSTFASSKLRAIADVGILHFHIVANLHIVADDRVGTEVDTGPDFAAILDFTIVGIRELEMVVVAHDDIGHAHIWTDMAAFADDRITFEYSPRIKDAVAANGDRRVHVRIGRIDDSDAIGHELDQLALAQYLFGFSHLEPRVDAQRFLIVRRSKSADALACADEHADNIRQVVFPLGVVIRHRMEQFP